MRFYNINATFVHISLCFIIQFIHLVLPLCIWEVMQTFLSAHENIYIFTCIITHKGHKMDWKMFVWRCESLICAHMCLHILHHVSINSKVWVRLQTTPATINLSIVRCLSSVQLTVLDKSSAKFLMIAILGNIITRKSKTHTTIQLLSINHSLSSFQPHLCWHPVVMSNHSNIIQPQQVCLSMLIYLAIVHLIMST